MKLKYLGIACIIAAFAIGGVANAQLINLVNGINDFEDDNIEYVYTLDGQGNEVRKTSGLLEVGDRLSSFITMTESRDFIGNQVNDFAGTSLELTGYSVIQVANIDGAGNITFAPAPEFEAIYGAGAMAALYEKDPGTLNVSTCHIADTCHADATDGALWMIAGFATADDFWVSSGGDVDLAVAAALGSATSFATAQLGLSILENLTGAEFGQVDASLIQSLIFGGVLDTGFVDILGSGQLLGGQGLQNDYLARSDFDFQVNVVAVPEPGTLMLMGLGLFAIGFLATRRRSMQVSH